MKNYHKNLVSVVIPTFNGAKYLTHAIDSALNQTYVHKEIIVVDDGSTDNTKNVIKPYLSRITFLSKNNGGPASARNIGISNSNGEYIAFLDADDYWIPEKLQIQVDFLKQNPYYRMVHTNVWIQAKDKDLYPTFVDKKPPSGRVFEKLFVENHINNLTVLLKQECFDHLGYFDESKELIGIEDYEFWLRVALYYKIAYIDKLLAVYRVHENNISNETRAISSNIYLLKKFAKTIKKVDADYPGVIGQKRAKIFFRRACKLMEERRYEDAKRDFIANLWNQSYIINSVLGILSCRLKTNTLFKNKVASIKCNHYGNYLLSEGRYLEAKAYFLMAIKQSPLQQKAYKALIKIFLESLRT